MAKWREAKEIVEAASSDLREHSWSHLRAMPRRYDLTENSDESYFCISVEHSPMVNGTSAIWVEAEHSYFCGRLFRRVVAGFEVNPEGYVTKYPTRTFFEAKSARKVRREWAK